MNRPPRPLPEAYTVQQGDRISVVHEEGVYDTRDMDRVSIPPWDGRNHIWVTAMFLLNPDPWDAEVVLGIERLVKMVTYCEPCGELWTEDIDLRCAGAPPTDGQAG